MRFPIQRLSHYSNTPSHQPIGRYPPQIKQAIEGLKHILSLTPPEQITIAGGSAGGHLTLNLLSHLLHPFKTLEPISLLNGGKLGGTCPNSPFLSFDYGKDSYSRNKDRDCLTLKW
jgi:hypothetical protein